VTGETPVVDAQSARARAVFDQSVIPQWRFRGTAIEQSLDNGATWTADFEAGRQISAASTPAPGVAWFGGVRGLIIRRLVNAWAIVSSPANADVMAITATSDRQAVVTFADGRAFVTTDGGVSWNAK
jgi:hypothetical protein